MTLQWIVSSEEKTTKLWFLVRVNISLYCCSVSQPGEIQRLFQGGSASLATKVDSGDSNRHCSSTIEWKGKCDMVIPPQPHKNKDLCPANPIMEPFQDTPKSFPDLHTPCSVLTNKFPIPPIPFRHIYEQVKPPLLRPFIFIPPITLFFLFVLECSLVLCTTFCRLYSVG